MAVKEFISETQPINKAVNTGTQTIKTGIQKVYKQKMATLQSIQQNIQTFKGLYTLQEPENTGKKCYLLQSIQTIIYIIYLLISIPTRIYLPMLPMLYGYAYARARVCVLYTKTKNQPNHG